MPSTGIAPRLYDAGALAVALLGAYLVQWPERPVLPEEAPAWWWVDLAGGVLAALVLLARRRAPVATALVVYALTVVCTSAWLAGAVATFSLAVRRPWPTAAALGAFSFAIGPVQGLFRLQTEESTSWGNLAW
ncbi:MAG TPA: hypothetical protein VNP37_21505, partial [Actinomycetospora sp.]|nr:hypothetical protein [Actinomycetospora sp.]